MNETLLVTVLCKLSPTAVRTHDIFSVSSGVEQKEGSVHHHCSLSHYSSIFFLLVQMQQVRGFSWSDGADERALLFHCVLLAGLLSFKDGILALHFRPGQSAVGQIPDDHRQLTDLQREETV